MTDGSVTKGELELLVQLLLGTLIRLAKWAPGMPRISPVRLGWAIEAFAFRGLESRH